MKVKLLNDGDYGDMENVSFPVIVSGRYYDMGNELIMVTGSELIRLAGNHNKEDPFDPDYEYAFYVGIECEVINEQIS
ncbi:hypothetical protein KDV25_06550 [Morganella morganii]|uniref:hypothetical protein n=1 Tax=Morganella morganii TaxID=582 RepID=UPI003321E2A2